MNVSTEKKRLLYVHHRSELGGAPSSLASVIGRLGDAFDVYVLCPDGPTASQFEDVGARVFRGRPPSFVHVTAGWYHGWRWLLLGPEIIRAIIHVPYFLYLLLRYRPHIVHLNDSCLVGSGVLARITGRRVVTHVRSCLAKGHFGIRRWLLSRLSVCFSNRVVCIDESVRDTVRSKSCRVIVIHNGIDIAAGGAADRLALRRETAVPKDAFLVGQVGYIYPEKGQFDFIEMARILTEQGIDCTYVFIGGGVYNDAFFKSLHGRLAAFLGVKRDYVTIARERVDAYDLAERFVFRGYMESVYDAVAGLDVIVFPSSLGGLGRSVLEAASSGVPAIGCLEREHDDVIESGVTGYVTPPGRPDLLAFRIRELHEDRGKLLEMGQRAREKACAGFDALKLAGEFKELYDGLT